MKEIQFFSTMICCMMLYKQDGGILHSNLENPGKYSRSEVSRLLEKRSYSRKTRNSEITKNMNQKRPRTTVCSCHFHPNLPVHSDHRSHKNRHFHSLFIIFIPITLIILSEKILIGNNPGMADETTVSELSELGLGL
jgi:hypothetical protein